MSFANDLTTKDWLFIISVIFGLALILVAMLGFINSKSKEGQKLQSKVDAYLSMGELAFTEATKQVGLTGKERKNVAIDYAENEMKKLGYKNVSIQLLSASIEKAYAKLKSTYDAAYNWGLSTNTDGSQYLTDKDGNGIPDINENHDYQKGTIEPVTDEKNKVIPESTTTTTTTSSTTQQSGLTPVQQDNESVKIGSLE